MPAHVPGEQRAKASRTVAATKANSKPGSIKNGYAASRGSAASKTASPAKIMTNNPIV